MIPPIIEVTLTEQDTKTTIREPVLSIEQYAFLVSDLLKDIALMMSEKNGTPVESVYPVLVMALVSHIESEPAIPERPPRLQ
jgi:hypothetical protein